MPRPWISRSAFSTSGQTMSSYGRRSTGSGHIPQRRLHLEVSSRPTFMRLGLKRIGVSLTGAASEELPLVEGSGPRGQGSGRCVHHLGLALGPRALISMKADRYIV